MKTNLLRGLALSALLSIASVAGAANIVIVNQDGAGEGFNDNTVVAPVGGNTGTTIGQQRLNAFQFAADIWGNFLTSAVTIRIQAQFDPLSCNSSSGVLGAAGPITVHSDFANAPTADTWFVGAEANKHAGSDLDAGNNDLNATFNADIDNNNNCLNGTNWYYGLDGNNGSDIDLVVVLLHEFAHGLGFASLVNEVNGVPFAGRMDIYSRRLFDEDLNKFWGQMTDAQRAQSSINPLGVIWRGNQVQLEAPGHLSGTPSVQVLSPAGIAGFYLAGVAQFGPEIDGNIGYMGGLVEYQNIAGTSSDGCDPSSQNLTGAVALIDRGTCNFTDKVKNAQDAGAIAAIIVNNVASPAFIDMGGTDGTITIPSLMVSQADGATLRGQLGVGVTVDLTLNPGQLAGANVDGRPYVYTPSPLEQGSSVSHWDVSAFPNLLMEPAINSDLPVDDADLTIAAFKDIQWFIGDVTPAPSLYVDALLGNHPNPFNPATKIQFSLANPADATLKIYDLKGRMVRTLDLGNRGIGDHEVLWDGTSDSGDAVASGVYTYELKAGDYRGRQRMVLVK